MIANSNHWSPWPPVIAKYRNIHKVLARINIEIRSINPHAGANPSAGTKTWARARARARAAYFVVVLTVPTSAAVTDTVSIPPVVAIHMTTVTTVLATSDGIGTDDASLEANDGSGGSNVDESNRMADVSNGSRGVRIGSCCSATTRAGKALRYLELLRACGTLSLLHVPPYTHRCDNGEYSTANTNGQPDDKGSIGPPPRL